MVGRQGASRERGRRTGGDSLRTFVILAAIALGLGGFAVIVWRSDPPSPLDEETTDLHPPGAPAKAAPVQREAVTPLGPRPQEPDAAPVHSPPEADSDPPPPRLPSGPTGHRPRSCRVSGQVIGAAGKPVGGARVYLMKDARRSTGGACLSGADGRFEMGELNSSHYFGLGAQNRTNAGRLEIGETLKPFYLAPGAHHEGEVILVGGALLAGGWIHLEDGSPVEGRSVLVRATTSDERDISRAIGVSSAADGTWAIYGRTGTWRDSAEIEVGVDLSAREGEDYVVLPASRRRCFVGDAALNFTIVPRRPEVEDLDPLHLHRSRLRWDLAKITRSIFGCSPARRCSAAAPRPSPPARTSSPRASRWSVPAR